MLQRRLQSVVDEAAYRRLADADRGGDLLFARHAAAGTQAEGEAPTLTADIAELPTERSEPFVDEDKGARLLATATQVSPGATVAIPAPAPFRQRRGSRVLLASVALIATVAALFWWTTVR